LPETWAWHRFANVFYPISASKNKVKTSEIQEEGKIPVIDQGQSYIAGYVDNAELEIELPGPVIIFGDHTTALKYVDFNFVAGADGVKILRPMCCDERYFYLAAKTLPIENRGYGRHYSRLLDNLFPLPPLDEQHRIVAKVDELMALCDQLEQRQTDSLQDHQILVETLLRTLVDDAHDCMDAGGRATHGAVAEDAQVSWEARMPGATADSAESTQQAWNRIAEHFDTLFTTEESIDQLKQTILQLAVMGRLVPQDPNDEPASVLLESIAEEKKQLEKEGRIKKQKALPDISEDEKPFNSPIGWEWVRADKFSKKITDGEHFRPQTQDGGVFFLSAKDIREDGVSLDDPLFISQETAEKALQRCDPEKGDVLIVSRGATVGRMCTVNIDDVFCLLGSVILIKPVGAVAMSLS
jgi:type I restriction enzyme S subunit